MSWPRMRRAYPGAVESPTAIVAVTGPGPAMTMTRRASRRPGNAKSTSSTRPTVKSAIRPPTAATVASPAPRTSPMPVAATPMRSEVPAPWTTRLQTSRPDSSVPNQCTREGAENALRGSTAVGDCVAKSCGARAQPRRNSTTAAATISGVPKPDGRCRPRWILASGLPDAGVIASPLMIRPAASGRGGRAAPTRGRRGT
jgi:hypothetical protein